MMSNKATKDAYTRIDSYDLVQLYMEGESKQKVDLKPLFLNFTFVEDMFSCAITGSILIKDAVNLFTTFPILGYEKIVVTFRTPGLKADYIKKTFYVVSVTDKVKSPNERAEVYRINFTSNAAVKDKTTKISKSYKGKVSDIAKKIYSQYIKETSDPELNAQETLGEQKYVIPTWSPFRTLEWLTKRAISSNKPKETNYVFFETVDGHQFVSLSELMSASPVISYFSVPMNTNQNTNNTGKNPVADFINVKSYQIINSNQKLKEQMVGAYASTLLVHDVTTKQWGRYTYNYNNDDKKVRYLTDNKLTKNNDKYIAPLSSIHLTTKQTGLMGKDYLDVQNQPDWLQRSISSNALLESVKVKIMTAGNSILRAGNVINFSIPKSGRIKTSDTESYDPYFSGKYIITTIRHIITPQGYTNAILLSKNSYEQPVPDKSTFMETGEGKKKNNSAFRR